MQACSVVPTAPQARRECDRHGRSDSDPVDEGKNQGAGLEITSGYGFTASLFISRAAFKARRQNLAAVAVAVFIETNRFRPELPQNSVSRSMRLGVATADTGKLIAAAMRLLAMIYREGFAYKKAGVVFLELVPAAAVQSSLFERPDDERSKARMQALDALNAKYGRGTVGYGFTGEKQRWKLRSKHISPRYTTDWAGLLRV